MNKYKYSADYDYPLLVELYDRVEVYDDDVLLLRRLIGKQRDLNILECFSGTGRILIPISQDGHRLTGIEMASAMCERAIKKLVRLES